MLTQVCEHHGHLQRRHQRTASGNGAMQWWQRYSKPVLQTALSSAHPTALATSDMDSNHGSIARTRHALACVLMVSPH
jgi:hypothetical protein